VDGVAPSPAAEKLQYDTARFQFTALSALADMAGRKFVFAHILLPHEPYVFAADGSYLGPSDRAGMTINERFQQQLTYTNTSVESLVQRLLARPEAEQPIVVIQADEGPYPPGVPGGDDVGWADATNDQLRTKFGILDAFYLPDAPTEAGTGSDPFPTI